VNAATFGGLSNNDKVVASFKSLGLPVCQVVNGEDLSGALETAVNLRTWF
jgi:hypothetical protein